MSESTTIDEVIITLVHGTWGRGFFPRSRSARKSVPPRWFEDGSQFRTALSTHLDQFGIVHRFEELLWSGSNSIRARYEASKSLTASLRDQASTNPKTPLVVIAHSHGGNVALHSVATLKEEEIGVLLVSLASPFLSIHDSPLTNPLSREYREFIRGLSILQAAFCLACVYLYNAHSEALWANSVLMAVSVGVVVCLVIAVALLLRPIKMHMLMAYPQISRGPLIILRAIDDEASLALAFGLIGTRLGHWLFSTLRNLPNMIWVAVRFWLVFALVGAVFRLRENLLSAAFDAIIFTAITYPILCFSGLIFAALCRTINGRELALGGILWDVNVQSVPDCRESVINVVTLPNDTRKTHGLRHSIYEHESCASEVARAIAKRQGRLIEEN